MSVGGGEGPPRRTTGPGCHVRAARRSCDRARHRAEMSARAWPALPWALTLLLALGLRSPEARGECGPVGVPPPRPASPVR